MASEGKLTPTELLAFATEILAEGGYRAVERSHLAEWPSQLVRLFEDPFGIVAVVVYETWAALSSGWGAAQEALVKLISDYVSSGEAKAWEGYLVLFTPSLPAGNARTQVTDIRYDTSRVRKLVATGEELKSLADVRRALLPLLPLVSNMELGDQESVLGLLPGLLSQRGVPESATKVVVDAFREQISLVEALHESLNRDENQRA